MAKARKSVRPELRLLAKLERGPGGCWLFTGHRVRKGYGQMGTPDGLQLTHRVAFQAFCGPIPDGLFVLHRCDNPACCNPTHLFLGTLLDNARDRDRKGRGTSGERAPAAKLNAEQVREVRRRLQDREPTRAVARRFGVTQRTVTFIRDGVTWRNLAA